MDKKQEAIKKAVKDAMHDDPQTPEYLHKVAKEAAVEYDTDTLDKRFNIDDKNEITRSLDTINYNHPEKSKYPKIHEYKSKESDTNNEQKK
jgi:hypothetical protein